MMNPDDIPAPLEATCPTLFARFACPPAICAEVSAAGRTRLQKRDLDRVVREHFAPDGARDGSCEEDSQLLTHIARACALTGVHEPIAAVAAVLGLGEARPPRRRQPRAHRSHSARP